MVIVWPSRAPDADESPEPAWRPEYAVDTTAELPPRSHAAPGVPDEEQDSEEEPEWFLRR